jgi:hypothetical protein
MSKQSGSGLVPAASAALLMLGLAGAPAMAHNDWGLPLVGGLVGGYALSSVLHSEKEKERAPAPVYVEPAPAAPSASATAAGIEHQLNVLDDLAAKGYITQAEYQARRQALLNQL